MYWITCLEGGPRRVNHAAASVGKLIYSFGGYCTGENFHGLVPMDVHVLCTENFRWTLLPKSDTYNTPFKRYGHSAVAYGKKIYVWGGRNDQRTCNILYCFNTENNFWDMPYVTGWTPDARDGHSACVHGQHMYIFGGFEGDGNEFCQDIFTLNLETMFWSYLFTLGDPPSFRDFHSAVVLQNRMYIFGGRGDCGYSQNRKEVYSSHTYYLDLKSSRWTQPCTFGDEPTGRRSHSGFAHNGFMYIFGGYNGIENKHFNEMYRYNPNTSEWRRVNPIGTAPCKRRRQSCVVVGNRMYLFGGTSPKMNKHSKKLRVFNDYDQEEANLMDHNDLHVLDFMPMLRTLAMISLNKNNVDISSLPTSLQYEIMMLRIPNKITEPLIDDISELNINC